MALKSFKEFVKEEQLDEYVAALGAGLSTAARTGGMSLVRAGRQAAPGLSRNVVGAIQGIRKGNLSKVVSNAMPGSRNNDSNQEASTVQQQEPLSLSGGGEINRVSAPPAVQAISNNRPASLSTGGQTIKGSATGSLMASQQNTMNSLYGQNNIGRFRR